MAVLVKIAMKLAAIVRELTVHVYYFNNCICQQDKLVYRYHVAMYRVIKLIAVLNYNVVHRYIYVGNCIIV